MILKKNIYLLISFIVTLIIYISALSQSTIASDNFSNSNSFSKSNETEISPSSRIVLVKKSEQLYQQGYREYQSNQYFKAEKSLEEALEILTNGDFNFFKIPRTKKRGFSFSPFGINIFSFSNISSVGYSSIKTNNSLEDIFEKLVNDIDKGSNPVDIGLNMALDRMSQMREQLENTEIEDILEGNFSNSDNSDNHNLSNKPSDKIKSLSSKSIEDFHKLEIKILRLLQPVIIAQNQRNSVEKALEVAQKASILEQNRIVPAIAYALNNEVLQEEKLSDNSFPDLLTLKNISIEDLKRYSQKNETTIVYYSIISSQEIFVWVIQPQDKISIRKINLGRLKLSLEELTRQTLQSASSYIDRGKEGKALIKVIRDLNLRQAKDFNEEYLLKHRITNKREQEKKLRELYRILIKPIENLLPQDPTKHVVFIPQQSLFLTPFAALKNSSDQSLIKLHTVSIATNVQNLFNERSPLKKLPINNEILIIGNPSNSNTSDLPGAEQEATNLALLSNSLPFIGRNATEREILYRINDAKIIHFATHGILDVRPSQPIDVILIIKEGDNSLFINRIEGLPNINNKTSQVWYGTWFDSEEKSLYHIIRTNGSLPGAIALYGSYLTSQEILNLKLNADLVVLSACNTAKGIIGDSTILGLPFSLGLAGVSRVVVSLWSVPDIPTQILMSEFYLVMEQQSLEYGKINEAQALRQAMLKVKNDKRYSDPINWAGFTLFDVSR